MDQIRTYMITGYMKKSKKRIPFAKNVRAIRKSDALEKIFSEMGSKHKAKRFDIKVIEVKEEKVDD